MGTGEIRGGPRAVGLQPDPVGSGVVLLLWGSRADARPSCVHGDIPPPLHSPRKGDTGHGETRHVCPALYKQIQADPDNPPQFGTRLVMPEKTLRNVKERGLSVVQSQGFHNHQTPAEGHLSPGLAGRDAARPRR